MFLAECVNIDAVEEAAQHELVIVRKMGETVGNALVDNSGYEASTITCAAVYPWGWATPTMSVTTGAWVPWKMVVASMSA